MVWRSAGLADPHFIVRLDRDFDTVALVGSNLRSTDTIRLRVGDTADGTVTAPTLDMTVQAWVGVKADEATAKSLVYHGDIRSGRYLRIDISAGDHPDQFVEVSRLVVGKRLTHPAVDMDAEMTLLDQSPSYTGPNWTAFDEYPVLAQWKVKTSWIKDADWRVHWVPFLLRVGITRPFLFIPVMSEPERWPLDMTFGNLLASATGQHRNANLWALELTQRALMA
jgi:hypothetical protein